MQQHAACLVARGLAAERGDDVLDAMVKAGCNLWRNWKDIDWGWESVINIINHWGEWGQVLQAAAGPGGPFGGHWNDPDMLL